MNGQHDRRIRSTSVIAVLYVFEDLYLYDEACTIYQNLVFHVP